MKLFLRSGLSLLVLFGFSIPLTAQTITFGTGGLQKGEVRTGENTYHHEMRIKVLVEGKVTNTISQQEDKVDRKVETVEEIEDGQVVQLKVKYEKVNVTVLDEPTKTLVVSGKTYRVKFEGEDILISYANGKQAPSNEVVYVRAEYVQYKTASRLSRYFAGKRATIGSRMPLSDEVVSGLFGRSEQKVEAYTFTLKETREVDGVQCAVFAVNAKLARTDSGQRATLELIGEYVISIERCLPMQVALSGPLVRSGGTVEHGRRTEVNGTGKIETTTIYRYSGNE